MGRVGGPSEVDVDEDEAPRKMLDGRREDRLLDEGGGGDFWARNEES